MRVAYLVNRYPAVSLTFIRREIEALEAHGVSVDRYSIRAADAGLVDEQDKAEIGRTTVVLQAGSVAFVSSIGLCALTDPVRFLKACALTVRTGWRSTRGLARHAAYLAEACVLRRWLRKSDAGHLHAHFGTNPAAVAMLCRALGGPPYSVTIHGPIEFDDVHGLALAEKIDLASFIVCVSQHGRSQTLRQTALGQWSKIHVVPCGVDTSFLEAEPTAVPETRKLVCIGRLSEQKGQALLLEAVACLVDKQVPVELELVGDGELRAMLEEMVRARGLEDVVQISGWATAAQIRASLLSSRALVLPSFAEGLPVVIMESLALARPVVSTFVAGIPELVDGESGWLVPAGSVQDLVACLERVLTLPTTELSARGLAGRRKVLEQHNVRVSAERLIHLFRGSSAAVSREK